MVWFASKAERCGKWDAAPLPKGWDAAPACWDAAPTGLRKVEAWDAAPKPMGWDAAPAGWDAAPTGDKWDAAPPESCWDAAPVNIEGDKKFGAKLIGEAPDRPKAKDFLSWGVIGAGWRHAFAKPAYTG